MPHMIHAPNLADVALMAAGVAAFTAGYLRGWRDSRKAAR